MMPRASLQPDAILQNQYKILSRLNEGGMGTVYKGRDLNFKEVNRLVAIKEMHLGDTSLTATMLDIFRREANLLATLSHPAMPRIYSFFEQNNRVYLVMEFIHGVDLDKIMEKTKKLPLEKVLEWAVEVSDVLHYLHSQKPDPIIFRDMKPSNIMIDSHGRARLVDFGIAKVIQAEAQPGQSDQENKMIGTPGYAPPEQYRGQVTPLSDVYSLGATLHHILTRQDPRSEPPFTFDRRPIKEFNPEVPDTLIAIVEKATQRDQADRWQSAAEMKTALERVRYGAVQEDLFGAMDVVAETDTAPTVEPRWTFACDGGIRGTPVFYSDLIYFGSDDSNIWAVRLSTGELAWKFSTGGPVGVSPVVDEENKQVVFGTETGIFHAIDYYSGRETWTFKARDRIRSTAAVAHRHVFFGSDDGHLYALVANNGRYVWDYPVGTEIQSRPFVTSETVIFGADSGDVMALELSGSVKWTLRAKGRVMAAPVVDLETGVCYVGSFDRHLYAVDVKSGFKQWQFKAEAPIVGGAVVGSMLVYVGAGDGVLYAMTKDTGRRRWTFETEKAIVSAPVLHKGLLYFGSNDGYLYCLEANSGSLRWRFKTGDKITGSPLIAGDMVLIGSLDKTLYALPLE